MATKVWPVDTSQESDRRYTLCSIMSDEKGPLSSPTAAGRQWVVNQAYCLNHYSCASRFWVEDQDGNVIYGVKKELSWMKKQWGKAFASGRDVGTAAEILAEAIVIVILVGWILFLVFGD